MIVASTWIAVFLVTLYSLLRMSPLLHLAQRESYQLRGFMHHHLRQTLGVPDRYIWILAVVSTCIGFVHATLADALIILLLAILGGVGIGTFLRWRRERQSHKLPLVWTARVKRLTAALLAITLVEAIALAFWQPGAVLLAGALTVVNTYLALAVTKPIEMSVQQHYKRQARSRLRQLRAVHQLRVVGITGSYGKTSCKFILGSILGSKLDVLVTPSSFNTPMGICKVVNRDIQAHHQVFIAEMGARHKGDIRELVRLAEPDHAMITAVGPAHLDTLGSLENIAKTKFDLARGANPDGIVVVNGDNPYCVSEAKTLQRDVLFYGLKQSPHLAAFAKDIRIVDGGTEFTLVLPGDGEVRCQTRLLGQHNVLNIIGTALLARRMGLTLEEVATGISTIEPVEHRLQLLDPGTGVLIIDDAFNANPDGAAAALEVLGQFEQRRKWIVTPGMVELGSERDRVHREFGRQMANVCDRIVLVGRLNRETMLQGLREAEYPEDHIFVADSLADAQQRYLTGLRPGDVVLFENDLPDHLERG